MRVEDVFSKDILEKYEFFEYNHALAILCQDFPQELEELRYVLELPMTEDVAKMFMAILQDREMPRFDKGVDGYTGFLFYDKNGLPEVAMHWEHRIKHMRDKYNHLYKLQIPALTPHICRHTYCTNMARAGMNPKTLQYLMGHSDISITMNVYTHLGLDDAKEEMIRMQELNMAREELRKEAKIQPTSQKEFRVV